jgi:DNA repair exonuclease SbcCD nuclease subunit
MRILVIGDCHFKHNNEIETNLMCDRIYEVVLSQNPDMIVVLGDTLDTHSHIDMNPFNRALKFLYTLSQMNNNLYILIGNHDRPSNTDFLSENSPFNACKMWKNTTIVDKVKIFENFDNSSDILTKTHKNPKIVFVPYVPNGRFMEALGTEGITPENIQECDLIFAHQEFKGCKMGAIISVHGDEWPADYPMVISGHIHDNAETQNNLLYPGTPIQLGYGVPPSKGVMLVNLETSVKSDVFNNSVTDVSLKTDAPDNSQKSKTKISYEYFDLKLPKKMIVHISPEELSTYQIPDNCFVKLVCKGDSKSIREITKLESVKDMLKNPRIKLSIQEDKSKVNINGVTVDVGIGSKVDTIPFQKRLFGMFKTQNDEIKNLFTSMFGVIEE